MPHQSGGTEPQCPAFFLQSLLEERLCLSRVTTGARHSVWGCQIRVVAGYTLGHDMVARGYEFSYDVIDDQVFVDRKGEGLTNFDVVQWL